MESLLQYLDQLHGDTLTHEQYAETGRKIAAYQLDTAPSETIPSERTDRVQNAILAIWSHNEVFTQDYLEECHRVLTGEVSPETASLPQPTIGDFANAKKARPNDGLDEVIDQLFKRVDASVRQTTEHSINRDERIEEAETIWQNFLNGEPITTDDLRVIQSTGLL